MGVATDGLSIPSLNSCGSRATGSEAYPHRPATEGPAGLTRNLPSFLQPNFGPIVRIPQRSSKGLRAPTAPVKSLKVSGLFNLGAEDPGSILRRTDQLVYSIAGATNILKMVEKQIGFKIGNGQRSTGQRPRQG